MNAQASCTNGACLMTTCVDGYLDCNRNDQDGCEIEAQTDNNHCGSCGHACTDNRLCTQGHCTPVEPGGCQSGSRSGAGFGGFLLLFLSALLRSRQAGVR